MCWVRACASCVDPGRALHQHHQVLTLRLPHRAYGLCAEMMAFEKADTEEKEQQQQQQQTQ
jgi:hypothetical protein